MQGKLADQDMADDSNAALVEQLDLLTAVEGQIVPDRKIKRANALLEARYQLSIDGHRLLESAIACLPQGPLSAQSTPQWQVLHHTDLRANVGGWATVSSLNRRLKRAADELLTNQVELVSDKGVVEFNWLGARAQHFDGRIAIALNPMLLPYIGAMRSHWSITSAGIQLSWRSPRSKRLYEIFRARAFYKRVRLLEGDVRKGLLLQGYDDVSHLKSAILTPCIEEINALSDLVIEFIGNVRVGRKVVGWDFHVIEAPNHLHQLADRDLINALRDLGLFTKTMQDVLTQYAPEHIKNCIDQVRKRGDAAENPAGLLLHILKDEGVAEEEQREAVAKATAAVRTRRTETRANLISIWRSQEAERLFHALPVSEQKKHFEAFDAMNPKYAPARNALSQGGLAKGVFRLHLVRSLDPRQPSQEEIDTLAANLDLTVRSEG